MASFSQNDSECVASNTSKNKFDKVSLDVQNFHKSNQAHPTKALQKKDTDKLNTVGIKTGALLSGKIAFYEGVLNVGTSSSIGFEYFRSVNDDYEIGVEYTYALNSPLSFRQYNFGGVVNFNDKLQTHYVLISRISNFDLGSDVIIPYAITGAGIAYFNVKNRGDKSFMAINLGTGLKGYIGNNWVLKLQGRFLLPLLFEGVGFFVNLSDPSNSGLSLNSTVPLIQGEFSIGLSRAF